MPCMVKLVYVACAEMKDDQAYNAIILIWTDRLASSSVVEKELKMLQILEML